MCSFVALPVVRRPGECGVYLPTQGESIVVVTFLSLGIRVHILGMFWYLLSCGYVFTGNHKYVASVIFPGRQIYRIASSPLSTMRSPNANKNNNNKFFAFLLVVLGCAMFVNQLIQFARKLSSISQSQSLPRTIRSGWAATNLPSTAWGTQKMEGRKDDIEINESCDKLIAITYQNHPAPFSVYSTTTIFPRRVSPLLMRKAYMHTHTHTFHSLAHCRRCRRCVYPRHLWICDSFSSRSRVFFCCSCGCSFLFSLTTSSCDRIQWTTRVSTLNKNRKYFSSCVIYMFHRYKLIRIGEWRMATA